MSRIADDDGVSDRRVFLARAGMCAGGLLCLGCTKAAGAVGGVPQQAPASATPAHKFAADSKMSFQAAWMFAYTHNSIPMLKSLCDELGKEKLLPTLQAIASRNAADVVRKGAPPPPKNTLAALVSFDDPYFWEHVLTMTFVEKSEKAAEIRVTECLWAKTFREAGAADIGYATVCHPDFASATAFNPKIRMTRTKTLMQGDEYCNHRWTMA